MSKTFQSISPIKMLASGSKSYDTPAKYLQEKHDIIYQEQYYKQKCQRLQKTNKDLTEELRILQTQNRQLKTQVHIYRESQQSRNGSLNKQSNENAIESNMKVQTEQMQKLLKEIRIIKNNHQMEITEYKNEQKKLNKQILQLYKQISLKQEQTKSKESEKIKKITQKNTSLEKQLKQMKKSIVQYMEQRDQSIQKAQRLKNQLNDLRQQNQTLQKNQKQLIQDKYNLQHRIKNTQTNQLNLEKESQQLQSNQYSVQNSQMLQSSRQKKARDQLYQFGIGYKKNNDKIKQSNFSIHTFNGTRHVPAEQAFQHSESLNNQIRRLQTQLQRQSITYCNQLQGLHYTIERCQKETQQKQKDLISLLTKVKPLILEKHKLTSKQNVSPLKVKQKVKQEREHFSKNAFGLKMLEIFLKKYKMQTF